MEATTQTNQNTTPNNSAANIPEWVMHLLTGLGTMGAEYMLFIKPLQEKMELQTQLIKEYGERIEELEELLQSPRKTKRVSRTTQEDEDDDEDDDEDAPPAVTLISDITFDTIHPGDDPNRPDVTRRQVKNEARVLDGQSVILGGLRKKITQDFRASIPFIGELPGLGKLFSNTEMTDSSTEMFIFITPKIIFDPAEDLERVKREQLCLRPGDIPEYLCQLVHARDCERNQLLEGWITILFGRDPERCYSTDWRGGEYDGR